MVRLNVLSSEEVESIHTATLRILEETGVQVEGAESLELLAGAGGEVVVGRVRLPPDLIERALAGCPDRVTVRGRDGSAATLGDGQLHWHNLGGAREVYEPRSGKQRPATLQDLRDSTRLLDALEGASTLTPFFTPCDVPGALISLSMYRHALPNTTKPLHGPGLQTRAEVAYAVRMAAVLGEPGEYLSLSVSPVSPLYFPKAVVEAILEIACAGVPFAPLPCPTAGTTAPFSLAGALAQQNAEVLAAILLAQLARPGLPVVYCGRLAMMEPRSGASVWGGVELGLASAATVQLAHHYRLPANVYGFATNAHSLDIQSGFERGLNAAIPALAGADELSGIGEMDAGVMGSYAQMVVDSELAASVRRLQRGFRVDADSLGVEVVADALLGGRSFTGHRHTRRYLREGEVLLTRLADRGSWETWERGGCQGMAERAQEEAARLLAEHEVPPLSQEQEKELDEIMAAAGRELVGQGS